MSWKHCENSYDKKINLLYRSLQNKINSFANGVLKKVLWGWTKVEIQKLYNELLYIRGDVSRVDAVDLKGLG